MVLKKIDDLTTEDIASICDHTFLYRTEYYAATIEKGNDPVLKREEAFENFFYEMKALPQPYAVCVRPEDVRHASRMLEKVDMEDIKIASVVGFPDGSWYQTSLKIFETDNAIKSGAEEIDMVLNYSALKKGDYGLVEMDIHSVVDVAHGKGALVKLILETSVLESEEIREVCGIADKLDVDFVKTSTGFGSYGAKEDGVLTMALNFPRGIKISGGVNKDNVKSLLRAASKANERIDLDPMKIRIGESSLLKQLAGENTSGSY